MEPDSTRRAYGELIQPNANCSGPGHLRTWPLGRFSRLTVGPRRLDFISLSFETNASYDGAHWASWTVPWPRSVHLFPPSLSPVPDRSSVFREPAPSFRGGVSFLSSLLIWR